MTSEIRANTLKNRVGLGTIEYSNTGPVISGVTTASNFKTGSTNVHSTGVELANINTGGGTATFGGNVHLGDGDIIKLGAGNDLTMRHNGSVSVIENFTGNFILGAATSGNLEIRQVINDEVLAKFISNGAVELYHNNNKKLETYNQGVSVSGNLVASGTIYANTNIEINNAAPQIFLVDSNNNSDFAIQNNNGSFIVRDTTNSANRISITSDGKIGIGVENPSHFLHLKSASSPSIKLEDTTNTNILLVYAQDSDSHVGTYSNHPLVFDTNSTERLRIDSNGNMGLGTNSLVGNAANVYFTVNGSTLGGIALKANGTTQGYLQGTSSLIRLSSDGSKPITFDTNGSERVRIDSTGRVLVNSTNVYGSIGGKFHVVNTNMGLNSFANNPHAQTFHFTKSRATSGQGGTIVQDNDFCGHLEWYADDGVDTASQIAKISGRINGTPGANDTPGELIFYTTADGANASTERLRIEADGRLVLSNSGGIQLSPVVSNLYQINGALSYYAENNAVYLNGAGDNGLLRLNATGVYNDRTAINIYGKDVGGYGDTITFKTVSVERLKITNTGQLLQGETSAVDSNTAIQFRKDVVGNQARFIFRNRGNNSNSRVQIQAMTLNRAANADVFSGIEKYQNGGMAIYNGENTNQYSNINFFTNGWRSLQLRNGNHSGAWCAEIDAYWGTSNGLRMEVGGPQSGTWQAIDFHTSHTGTQRGYIGVTYGGVSYNSSSDYRMKQDVVDLTSAIDRVKSLKPKRFRWKEDLTHTVDGFLAHEAQTVVPESVQGEKDGEQMQVMDNSKLVPVLTAALKEAIAKIENLETKVAVLESS